MPALDVLTLDAAKRYLNIPASETESDDELVDDFIGPAVERVERHLGRALVDAASATPSELLACKVVLGDYWQTQRMPLGSGAWQGYGGPEGGAQDTAPMSSAAMATKLTEILGPANTASTAPSGSFPSPRGWPDPAERTGWSGRS